MLTTQGFTFRSETTSQHSISTQVGQQNQFHYRIPQETEFRSELVGGANVRDRTFNEDVLAERGLSRKRLAAPLTTNDTDAADDAGDPRPEGDAIDEF